jgi:Fe-S cluster biogenesis protein NfuA
MLIEEKIQLISRINAALEGVRPHLRVDGGDVEVVDVTPDKVVLIRWMGMCESCTMSAMTLKAGLTEAIQAKIPEIIAVEAINGLPVEAFTN